MAIKFLHDLDVSGNIDLNDNQALNMVLQQLTTNPPTVVEGKIFQNTTSDKVYVGLNGSWVELSSAIGDITEVIGGTNINVSGGGSAGQAGAIRHGLSRALEKMDPELRVPLKKDGHMRRDPRKLERKKPGQPGARKRFQFSKR